MKRLALIATLTLISTGIWGDFSCPGGTAAVCLENVDTVCPSSAKCVSNDVVCFDKHTCDSNGGFICESKYDAVMDDYKEAVQQHDELASENVGLRERRLEQKNCVMNAPTLEEAQKCVR